MQRATLVAYRAGSDLAGKTAMFVILLLAARALPTEDFGVFSLAATLGWILSVASDLGMQLYLAREVARAPDRIAEILPAVYWTRFTLALAAHVVAMALAAWWVGPADALAFILIVGAYLAGAMVEFVGYLFRGLSRTDIESTISLGQRLTTLGIVSLMLWRAPSLVGLAHAMFWPAFAAFGVSSVVASTLARRAGRLRARLTLMSPSVFARDVFPIGAGILLSALYFRIDVFLVEAWRGVDEVARYNAVFRLVEALRLFPAAVLAVWLPTVFGPRDPAAARRLAVGLTAFGVVAAIVLYPLAPWVVTLAYGDRYADAGRMLQVLLLAFPLLSLNYALTHQLIGWDGQRAYAWICAMALAVNLGINAWLIPRYGGVGAAWATIATEVFLTVACVRALRRRSPRHAGQSPAS